MNIRNRYQMVILGCIAMLSTAMCFIWVGKLSVAKPFVKCVDVISGIENSLKSAWQNGQTGVSTNTSLPEIAIARRVWFKYPKKKWHGLQLPLITCNPMGYLGNVMGEYATILAVGRIYGVTVRLLPSMRNQLIKIFPNLTIPLLPVHFNTSEWTKISKLTSTNYGQLEVAAAGLNGPGPFVLTGWSFEMQLFNTYRHDIMQEFNFSKKLQEQVRQFWKEKLGNNTSSVRIGVHVRRGDYVKAILGYKVRSLPGDAYFKRAMDHYRAKFDDIRFLVASDDMAFVKNAFHNYTDVLYTPGSPRELDMALTASCNHSIITVGSFGFWCGYLAGGEVVYPNITSKNPYPFQRTSYSLAQLNHFTPLEPY